MLTKAHAEWQVEHGGVPYTALRPPAILGAGDVMISAAFAEALMGPGLPLLRHAQIRNRVSLAFPEGLAQVVLRCLERGPLFGPVHVVDAELSFEELAWVFARALGQVCTFAPVSWLDVARRPHDAGFQWLVASARFGQHYSRKKLLQDLGYRSALSLESAVAAGISGLQGGKRSLF
jgi:nucleoside-diphosphate-sugar epimerase